MLVTPAAPSNLPSMEPAGNVRMVYERDELVIRTTLEVPIALSEITIDLDRMLDYRHLRCLECTALEYRLEARLRTLKP